MNAGKAALIGVYAWGIAGAIAPDLVPGGRHGARVVGGLLAAHAVEVAVFMKDIRATGEPAGPHVLQTLLFGVIHHAEIKQKLANAAITD